MEPLWIGHDTLLMEGHLKLRLQSLLIQNSSKMKDVRNQVLLYMLFIMYNYIIYLFLMLNIYNLLCYLLI